MPEQDDFMQIALSVVEATKTEGAAATETPPSEPKTEIEPQSGADGAGKGIEPEKVVVADEKPAEEPKKPDWKAAASAERQKRASREANRSQATALTAELEQYKAKLARYEAIEARKATDPLGAAEEFGLNYDTLTKKYIESLEQNPAQATPEVKTLIQNFHTLKDQVLGLQQELLNERRQKIVGDFEAGVKSLIQSKGDEFELLSTAKEGPALVKAIVAAHWKDTAEYDSQGNVTRNGETMSTEVACKKAEAFFEEEQLKRFAGTKKFKALAGPSEKKPEPQKPAGANTLNSSMLRGGGESISFVGELDELASLAKRLESQQGN